MAVSLRGAALRILKLRPHSEFEVRTKLARKKFSAEDVNEAVKYLYSVDLLDDRAFTKSWIAYRLARPFGFKRITLELHQKGIAKDIIDEMIAPYKAQEDQEVILDLARRRAVRLSNIDPVKRRKRIMDFLLRRGFSIDAVMKAIKKI